MPVLRANPAVVETDLVDELVLLDPTTREMFSLNAAGRIVWRALGESADGARELAIARITEAFDVDAAVAAADVDALLGRLVDAGLVEALPTADGHAPA